ncbi:MAG: RidA family protein, partial [Streptosporangiaceae bacterium]
IDGCSDLLVEIFGDAGRHTRSAVGLAELPFGIAVEIELIARLVPEHTAPAGGERHEPAQESSISLPRTRGSGDVPRS